MKYLVLFLLILNFVSVVSADCQDNQIDINSASIGELEELNGIGSVKAQAIIDTRPFNSVNDLIKVYGIGEKTLEKIKVQGLACVEGEDVEIDEKLDEKTKTPKESTSIGENPKINIVLTPKKENTVLNGVVENSEEVVYESKNAKILKYTPYAFSVFLIFVIGILIFDK
ncbi:MAG: helix-hairpin-helix domain-containing protein [Nanoarchaeota archaeon]|nr:helix-hairpin-helix domain-containing protein [Nanoarchaeota archaeon]